MFNSTLIKAALIKIVPSLSEVPALITPAVSSALTLVGVPAIISTLITPTVVCSAFTLAGKCIMYKREHDQRECDREKKREKEQPFLQAQRTRLTTLLVKAEKDRDELLGILRSKNV